MPTVTFILGLCGAGKTWLADRIPANKKFDEGFLMDPVKNTRELARALLAGQDAVVVEIGFCRAAARQAINQVLNQIPNVNIQWICIENDLEKANRNCRRRIGHSGNPEIQIEINRQLSSDYTYPEGITPLRMWSFENGADGDNE